MDVFIVVRVWLYVFRAELSWKVKCDVTTSWEKSLLIWTAFVLGNVLLAEEVAYFSCGARGLHISVELTSFDAHAYAIGPMFPDRDDS
jgi:hypothetical protein